MQLRFRLTSDKQYPRRILPTARIGTALHRTLEAVSAIGSGSDLRSFCLSLIARFDDCLDEQRLAAEANPRTRCFDWPSARIDRLKERLIEFGRTWYQGPFQHALEAPASTKTRFEFRITTPNQLLTGTIDRVDTNADGVTLVDYKSSASADDTSIDYALAQLEFYSYLWWRCNGSWPSRRAAVFISTGESFTVPVDVEASLSLGHEVEDFARSLPTFNKLPASGVAAPGESCRFCSYKPWCKPFWDAGAPYDPSVFEGQIESVQKGEGASLLLVRGKNRSSEIRFQDKQFPYLAELTTGNRIRVLDAEQHGVGTASSLTLRPSSEGFVLEDTDE